MNLFARFVGVIFSPRQTFESVAAHPRALGMLAIICVLSAILLGAFFSTQIGKDAWLEAATAGNPDMPPEQYAVMEKMANYAGVMAIAQAVIGVPIFIVLIAGILFAIFNAAMGGNATFKQVFAVTTHAWVIPTVSQLFTLPLSYSRGTLSSATNVAVLLPMLDETSFLGAFLGSIDFFLVWACFVLAVGLAVLYRRKTQPIAITIFSIYGVIALIIAFVKSS